MISLKELYSRYKAGRYKELNSEWDWTTKFMGWLSLPITKVLLHTPITPNQVTLLHGIVWIIGSLFFISQNYWFPIIGVVILYLACILDEVDGVIARYKNITSINGSYLDSMMHIIGIPILFVCITLNVYLRFNNIWLLAIGFLFTLSISFYDQFYTKKLQIYLMYGKHKRKDKHAITTNKVEFINVFYKKLMVGYMFITSTTLMKYILLVCAIFNILIVAFILLSLIHILNAIVRGLYEFKRGFGWIDEEYFR